MKHNPAIDLFRLLLMMETMVLHLINMICSNQVEVWVHLRAKV